MATPFLVASSYLMYKRLYLGEEQKRLPRAGPMGPPAEVLESVRRAEEEAKKEVRW